MQAKTHYEELIRVTIPYTAGLQHASIGYADVGYMVRHHVNHHGEALSHTRICPTKMELLDYCEAFLRQASPTLDGRRCVQMKKSVVRRNRHQNLIENRRLGLKKDAHKKYQAELAAVSPTNKRRCFKGGVEHGRI